MLETKEQKQIFIGCIVLVVILIVVSIWNRPQFLYVNKPATTTNQLSAADAQAYLDYLATIKTDPEASKKLFETIMTEKDVRAEVETALQTDKPVQIPAIDEGKIKVNAQNDSQHVTDYLSNTLGKVYAFNNQTSGINENLLAITPDDATQLMKDLDTVTKQLYDTAVPSEAVNLQKSLLTAIASYEQFVDTSVSYDAENFSGDDVWPAMYQTYKVVNDKVKQYTSELNRIAGKYQIAQVDIRHSYELAMADYGSHVPFTPTAQAFLGIPDVSITIGDIPRIITDAVKEGLSSAFLQFLGAMLDKLIAKIEQNYMIANFLYYSDALVNAQYSQDYLSKYATGTGFTLLDQQMIKTFIPQLSCGNHPAQVDSFFEAKAQTYLGFDPATLDPHDPNYYEKMTKVGGFLASPSGWQQYYEDIASQAQGAAQQAATLELTSSGLKTPKDVSQLNIKKSINSIISAERGAFNSLMNFGAQNADTIIGSVVSKLTQNLANKFIFSGISGSSSGGAGSGVIGVLKEQSVCADTFQLTPVVGIDDTQYKNSGAKLTKEDAQAVDCGSDSDPNADGCATAVNNFLNKCVSNPSGTDPGICSSLADSAFVDAKLAQCAQLQGRVDAFGRPVPLPAECVTLQSLVSRILK